MDEAQRGPSEGAAEGGALRLWSRGLGRIALPLRMRETERRVDEGHLVINGRIREGKVNWEYRMTFEDDDMLGFLRLITRPPVAAHVAEVGGARLWFDVVGRAIRFFGALGKAVLTRTPKAVPIRAEEVE